MNRSQLLNEFAERQRADPQGSRRVLDVARRHHHRDVASGEDVAISGFAKFRRIDRPARLARNPATGETVKVKAKRVARITPLKNFKDSVLSGKAPKPAAKKAAAQEGTRQEGSGQEGSGQEGSGEEGHCQEDREEGTGAQARQAALTRSSKLRVRGPGPSARAHSRVRSRVVQPRVRRRRARSHPPPADARRSAPPGASTTHKEALLVRVETDDADGWGEVGAEPRPRTRPRRSTPRGSCCATSSCPACSRARSRRRARAPRGAGGADRRGARRAAPLRGRLARVVSRRHRARTCDAGVAIGAQRRSRRARGRRCRVRRRAGTGASS